MAKQVFTAIKRLRNQISYKIRWCLSGENDIIKTMLPKYMTQIHLTAALTQHFHLINLLLLGFTCA